MLVTDVSQVPYWPEFRTSGAECGPKESPDSVIPSEAVTPAAVPWTHGVFGLWRRDG